MAAKKSPKSLVSSVTLEGTTQRFIQTLVAAGGPPIHKMSIEDARKVLDSLQSQPIEKLPAHIEDRTIAADPTGEVSLRIVRPEKSSGMLPVIMYFHGGGWILGNANTHDRLVRELANGAKAAVVFVNYTPSPEAKYPTAIEQAYAATKYIAEHGGTLNLDPTRLAVAGDSVGGNMAAAVTLLAKDRGGPQINFQLLFYPVTDASLDTPSYRQFAKGPWLTKAAMKWFWDAYEPRVASRKKPTISPLRASVAQLKGLPSALVLTDENDVLRDEGEAYAQKLTVAGVHVTAVRYLATIHDFVMLNPLANTPAARSAIALAIASLQKALGTAEPEVVRAAGTGRG